MNRYRYVVRLEDAVNPFEFGSKATQLSRAIQHKILVPRGFVISESLVVKSEAGEVSMEEELNNVLNELGSIAVRSSAIGEDSQNQSYAGQYMSTLNVASIQEIKKAIISVRQSVFSRRVKAYREKFGITGIPKMAIILHKMVSARAAGILFTQDPVTKEDEIIVEASLGLGESIASGRIIPDFFRLNRAGMILEQRSGNGTDLYKNKPCLNRTEIQKLHQLATRCENVFGKCLDIEWAFGDQKLYLLQCRSITG